jgi:hypothetical protein
LGGFGVPALGLLGPGLGLLGPGLGLLNSGLGAFNLDAGLESQQGWPGPACYPGENFNCPQ